jgi:hypothetical protein
MKEACLKSKEPTSLEVEYVVVHEEVPKEEAAVGTVRALKKQYQGLAPSRKAPQSDEEMDPGQW